MQTGVNRVHGPDRGVEAKNRWWTRNGAPMVEVGLGTTRESCGTEFFGICALALHGMISSVCYQQDQICHRRFQQRHCNGSFS
jgi:hypothetical protein